MTPDILITNCSVLKKPTDNSLLTPAFIAIHNGIIIQVDHMDNVGNTTGCTELDGQGQLAMSGLVNGHCHAPMTLFRGLADDLELNTWLHEHIFPAEATHVSPKMVYWCSKLAAAEMLLSGTTTVADGYFYEHEATRAFIDAGIRSVPAQGIIDFPAPGVPDPAKNIETAASFIDDFQNQHPLVQPAAFAHAPYTCSNATLQQAKRMTREKGVPLFIHLGETRHEQAIIADPQGATPVQHLDALSILDGNTVCVHCVSVTDEDIDILSKRESPVILCPQSNLKLASGIAPFPQMVKKRLRVGLGTDGAASNNSLDMFQEMDTCAKVQKLHALNPVAGSATEIVLAATAAGAGCLSLPENIGTLEPGSIADLILIDINQPHMQPFYGPDTLVYSGDGKDVSSVIVNGKMIVDNRQLLSFDLEETKYQVRKLAQKVMKK